MLGCQASDPAQHAGLDTGVLLLAVDLHVDVDDREVVGIDSRGQVHHDLGLAGASSPSDRGSVTSASMQPDLMVMATWRSVEIGSDDAELLDAVDLDQFGPAVAGLLEGLQVDAGDELLGRGRPVGVDDAEGPRSDHDRCCCCGRRGTNAGDAGRRGRSRHRCRRSGRRRSSSARMRRGTGHRTQLLRPLRARRPGVVAHRRSRWADRGRELSGDALPQPGGSSSSCSSAAVMDRRTSTTRLSPSAHASSRSGSLGRHASSNPSRC